MLDAARLAPSATNDQPWHFIVICDKQLIKQMQDMVNARIDDLLESLTDEDRKLRVRKHRFYSNYFVNAPVVIAVLAHPWPADASPDYQRPHYDLGLQSVSAATCQLVLAATALGYASCWASGPIEFAGAELEAMLDVREPWRLVALVTVGAARRWPEPRPRRSLEEIATFIK